MTPTQFRNWRLKKGITQEKAAELLNVSIRWISKVETGKGNLSKKLVNKIKSL